MNAVTTLRRRVAATAVIFLVPTLAACGFGVQTNKQYQSAAGVDNRDGVVQILNAAVVIPQAGSTNGVFVGTFVNTSGGNTPDQSSPSQGSAAAVESISVAPGGGTVDPKITLAPSSAYNPQPAAQPGNHGIPVTLPSGVTDGAYVTMKFVINSGTAQTITMRVPVFPASDSNNFWAKYIPSPTTVNDNGMLPSSTPTPKP